MKGIQYDNDPYSVVINDKSLRPILKLLLLALLNAETEGSAIQSDNSVINKSEKLASAKDRYMKFAEEVLPLTEIKNLKPNLSSSGFTFKNLVEMFKEAHQPIAGLFCTKIGYRLMNIDSRIATGVLVHFADINEACLPVHDSFIVESRLQYKLKKVMASAYQKIVSEVAPDDRKYSCKIG